jgi:glycosyltransferase involved in cell wall biosynthesis
MSKIWDVSVIIPVFNGEKFLKETIDSVVLTREFTSTQIIVVNDGSTDSTAQILNQYIGKIEIINQKNSGQASAINCGLAMASANFTSIVNSDDPIYNPQIFKKSLDIFLNNNKIVATYPNWKMINDNSEIIKEIEVADFSREELIGGFNCIIGPGGVFKTQDATAIGGWNSEYKFVPDYDFWLKLSNFGDFKKIPDYLATWRYHNNSISVRSKGMAMANERITVMEEFLLNSHIEDSLKKRAKANSQYSAALLSFFDKKVPGRKLFWNAVRIYPLVIKKKSIKQVIFLFLFPISFYIVKKFKISPKI